MVMESVRKKFIESALLKSKIAEYVQNFLSRAWVANVDIQHSPIATKIFLEVVDPRGILGRRGRRLKELTERLKKDLGISNPQISIVEVKNPWLDPTIVAKKAARGILRGGKVRGVLFRLLRQIMQNGAIGAEIVADGKIGAKGARSRKVKVYAGFVPKAGYPAEKVRYAHYNAVTKHGIIGITVRIATEEIYEGLKEGRKKGKKEEEHVKEGENEGKGA